MRSIKLLTVMLLAGCFLCACGGGGGGGGSGSTTTISSSISTVVSSPSAVGTVSISGVASPVVVGLKARISYPSGVSVDSAVRSGITPSTSIVTLGTSGITSVEVILSGTDGFASGEIMRVNFGNVQLGALSSQFTVSLLEVFDANGVQIQ